MKADITKRARFILLCLDEPRIDCAPEKVVAQERERMAGFTETQTKVKEQLAKLPSV